MSDTDYKKVHSWLKAEHRDLQTVIEKAKLLEELNRKVSVHLEKNITEYCRVANLIGNKLIIIAANGSIATQLRFQMADLLRKFKQDPLLKNIQQIEFKVRPAYSPAQQSKVRKMQPLTEETAKTIRKIAESLEDPGLRAIMERIAGRIKS